MKVFAGTFLEIVEGVLRAFLLFHVAADWDNPRSIFVGRDCVR